MPHFTYVLPNGDGTERRKTIESSTLEEAREMLRSSLKSSQLEGALASLRMNVRSVWVSTDDAPPPDREEHKSADRIYAPLIDTLRLYAGWLFAWYFVIYALGSMEVTRSLPYSSPIIEHLFLSPIIANLTCGVFLFLLLTTLHRAFGSGVLRGFVLTGVGMIGVILFALNT